MFLTGTLLNVVTVLVGTGIGLLLGRRLPPRIHEALTTGLGFFTLLLGTSMGVQILTDPAARPGDDIAVLAAVLLGGAIASWRDSTTGSNRSVAGSSAAWRGAIGPAASPRAS